MMQECEEIKNASFLSVPMYALPGIWRHWENWVSTDSPLIWVSAAEFIQRKMSFIIQPLCS